MYKLCQRYISTVPLNLLGIYAIQLLPSVTYIKNLDYFQIRILAMVVIFLYVINKP